MTEVEKLKKHIELLEKSLDLAFEMVAELQKHKRLKQDTIDEMQGACEALDLFLHVNK